MALPTAQLGGMPNMQMPYNIPVQTYTKEPKAWEKILMGIVANVATQGLEKGVSNYMQPDYAPQPAEGLDKFMHGPTISQGRAHELDVQDMDQQKLAESKRQNTLDNLLKRTAINKDATSRAETLAQQTSADATRFGIENRRSDIALTQAQLDAAHQRLRDEILKTDSTRQGKVADAQIGDIEAQKGQRDADARSRALQTRLMLEGINEGRKQRGQPLLDAEGKDVVMPPAERLPGLPGSRTTTAAVTSTPSTSDDITALVNQGTSVDDIVAQLAGAQDRQVATQSRADLYQVSDEARAARSQAKIDEIRRRLGMPPLGLEDTTMLNVLQ